MVPYYKTYDRGGSNGVITHRISADFDADLLLDDLSRHQELSKKNLVRTLQAA
jgi:hypothetical protein